MSVDATAPRAARMWAGNALVLLALGALCGALLPLHAAPWWPAAPRADRWLWAAVAAALYAGFTAWMLLRGRRDAAPSAAAGAGDALLVAWASQTGFAQDIAERTAATLAQAGVPARAAELGALDLAALRAAPRALFVVSTTGEGDAPDAALAFVRDVLAAPAALPGLEFAVLALGDRSYDHFCGFGHRLDQWLRQSGARPLFDLVEVDNGDPGALRHWQHHLGVIARAPELPDWRPAAYTPWRLRERIALNPGSQGESAFHLALAPPPGARAEWTAGDIAEVGPRNAAAAVDALLAAVGLAGAAPVRFDECDTTLRAALARAHLPSPTEVAGLAPQALADALRPLPHREYSIASLPGDGTLQLLVRRMRRPDGRAGLGSGWLCEHAAIGQDIDLRIRANPGFRPPAAERALLLIGNGTGIAGLRALLKARVAAGARRNWLLFGERSRACDFHYRGEIERWQSEGFIERLDLAFSRDGAQRRYVQHALADAADVLRARIADGAAVYVCGSLQGMAPGVDAVLRETLGEATVEQMRAEGRYRRDVY